MVAPKKARTMVVAEREVTDRLRLWHMPVAMAMNRMSTVMTSGDDRADDESGEQERDVHANGGVVPTRLMVNRAIRLARRVFSMSTPMSIPHMLQPRMGVVQPTKATSGAAMPVRM